jgi:magnesium transporter
MPERDDEPTTEPTTGTPAADGVELEAPGEPSAEDLRVEELMQHSIDVPELADAVEAQEPADAAVTLESLRETEAVEVLAEMDVDAAAEALAYMQTPLAVSMLQDLIDDEPALAGKFLEEMAPDDATDLLQALPVRDRERLLASMASGDARRLRELMVYAPDSAGGMMTTQHFSVREAMTVAEATESIRRHDGAEILQHAFVTDAKGHLKGIISLRRLLVAKPSDRIADICERTVDAIAPDIDREEVAREFERYRYAALPVVDAHHRLLGVVTVDDVIDIIRAEGTEDAQRMVGAGREEAVYSSVGVKFRGRFPWLLVNLVTSSIGALVVLRYQGLIAEIAVLAAVMPLVANQSGNAGQQSLAVTLRGIVLDQIRPRRAMPHIVRETSVGLVNGIICGVMVGSAVAGIELALGRPWQIGAVIALSMACTLMIGCLTGSTLPLLMKRMGADPATASTIFLTMVTDTMSFLVFLGLASAFSHLIGAG